MADLFTNLAGEESISQAVQPRLKARFEDRAFASDGFPEDAQAIDDPQTAGQVDEPVGRHEPLELPEAPSPVLLAAIETIRELLPAPDLAPRRTQLDRVVPPARVTPAPLEAAPQITATLETNIIEARANEPSDASEPVIAPVQPPEATAREPQSIMPAAENAMPVEAQPPPDLASVIEVHIGRVELRQSTTQDQVTSRALPRFQPQLSLSDYLAKRNGENE